MAYDLQEQEQLDELKAWWKDYGRLVLLGVALGAVAVAGFQGWRYYRHTQSLAAAALYEQLEQAERAGDRKKVRDIAGGVVANYASTPYASFAALSAALRAALREAVASAVARELQSRKLDAGALAAKRSTPPGG